jgi:hypothetical protein
MRLAWIALTLLATTAASPPRSLPIPPIPPAHPPTARFAPMPDRDAQAPVVISRGPEFSVRDFRVRRFQQGMGYAPGSSFESGEDKRPIQTPGVTYRVPLQ